MAKEFTITSKQIVNTGGNCMVMQIDVTQLIEDGIEGPLTQITFDGDYLVGYSNQEDAVGDGLLWAYTDWIAVVQNLGWEFALELADSTLEYSIMYDKQFQAEYYIRLLKLMEVADKDDDYYVIVNGMFVGSIMLDDRGFNEKNPISYWGIDNVLQYLKLK